MSDNDNKNDLTSANQNPEQDISESETKSKSLIWSLREKFAKKKHDENPKQQESTDESQSSILEDNHETNKSSLNLDEKVNEVQASTEAVTDKVEEKKDIPPPPPPPPPKIDLKISSDNMVAYIRVKIYDPEQSVLVADVLDVLGAVGVTFGICNDEIINFCESKAFFSELVAARGVHPVDGTDGSIEYLFKTGKGINLLEKEDGTVNYRELGLIQNVIIGQPLATLVLPGEGVDGITVFGGRVPFKQGRKPELKNGENTEISQDGLQILAKNDGCVEFRNSQGVVDDVYVVKGDVNIGVGNLDCKGSIVIQGDVHEGFILKAKKDIVVKGSVEGATLVSGGKVTISNGMNGMGIGSITADGDVVSKYIENTRITSGGDIFADVIMHSKVKAARSVILKGSKASLIGGICDVGLSVIAGFVGSHTNAVTMINIQSPRIEELLSPTNDKTEQIGMIKKEISELKGQEHRFQEDIERLTKEMMIDPQAKTALKRAMNEKNHIAGMVAKLEEELAELTKSASQIGEFKVVASKICYTGTKINIGYIYYNVEDDYNNSKFHIDSHTIVSGPLLPSDRA